MEMSADDPANSFIVMNDETDEQQHHRAVGHLEKALRERLATIYPSSASEASGINSENNSLFSNVAAHSSPFTLLGDDFDLDVNALNHSSVSSTDAKSSESPLQNHKSFSSPITGRSAPPTSPFEVSKEGHPLLLQDLSHDVSGINHMSGANTSGSSSTSGDIDRILRGGSPAAVGMNTSIIDGSRGSSFYSEDTNTQVYTYIHKFVCVSQGRVCSTAAVSCSCASLLVSY
jgi:hypothetical protein